MNEQAKRNGSEAAFPDAPQFLPDGTQAYGGMYGLTKREYFAGLALSLGEGVWPGGSLPGNADALAKNCVAIADALLAALDAEEGS